MNRLIYYEIPTDDSEKVIDFLKFFPNGSLKAPKSGLLVNFYR